MCQLLMYTLGVVFGGGPQLERLRQRRVLSQGVSQEDRGALTAQGQFSKVLGVEVH